MRVIHTADLRMKKILETAERVAASRAPILITGDSGTGKELLSRFIHSKSQRAEREFVAINCAAIPDGLIESELFGYEKGAFTGANQRKLGKFELAHQGTFLLDEISELPMMLQSKLLRTIQEAEVQRLGGLRPVNVDVRIIAATNKDLTEQIRKGLFREDLYYRLNVIPLHIPPLRERANDIESLAKMFLEGFCQSNGLAQKTISGEAMTKLKTWTWPGNVRELQNVIERSALLSQENEISVSEVEIQGYRAPVTENGLKVGMTVSEAERLLILKTLEHTAQNRTQAAHILGISIRTLRNKLNEYRTGFGGLT